MLIVREPTACLHSARSAMFIDSEKTNRSALRSSAMSTTSCIVETDIALLTECSKAFVWSRPINSGLIVELESVFLLKLNFELP